MIKSRTSRIILDQLKTAKRGYRGKEAVVIGAGVGGLLAARVLAEHFDRVSILERDVLPKTAQARKGAPAGNHTHALLKGGSDVIEDLFPGFWSDMTRKGTTSSDCSRDWVWFHHGVWKKRQKTDLLFYMQTRPMLEQNLRERLLNEYPNVELVEDCQVTGLLHDDASRKVNGVLVQFGYDGAKAEIDFPADLVVDVSGRQTRVPRMLEDLGYGKVPESEVKIDICYASRFYEPPKDATRDWHTMIVYSKAPKKRIAYISPVEGDRWVVTLAGYHGDHPPEDDAGFLEFTKGLPRSEYHEIISKAKPLTNVQRYKLPSDLRRHYEKMRKFPQGLVVMGDAVCSFNPIFGQGMTTAALGAKLLHQCLQSQRPDTIRGLANRFRRKTTSYNNTAWLLATTEDMRYAETEAKRPLELGFLNWYKGTLLELSSVDADIARRFMLVLHFQRGLAAILHPTVLFKALTWKFRRNKVLAAQSMPPKPQRKNGMRSRIWSKLAPRLGFEYMS